MKSDFENASKVASDKVDDLIGKVEKLLGENGENLTKKAKQKAENLKDDACNYIQDHPGSALLWAALGGAVLSSLLFSRR